MIIKTISGTYERKINLDDYNSLNIGGTAWADLEEGETPEAVIDRLIAISKEAARKEATALLNYIRANGRNVPVMGATAKTLRYLSEFDFPNASIDPGLISAIDEALILFQEKYGDDVNYETIAAGFAHSVLELVKAEEEPAGPAVEKKDHGDDPRIKAGKKRAAEVLDNVDKFFTPE